MSTPPPKGPSPRLASLIDAAPDLGVAVMFLVTWIAPEILGVGMISALLGVMLLEFIVVHSAAYLSRVMVQPGDRQRKARKLAAVGGFYALFAFAISFALGSPWPFVTFAALILNRIAAVLLGKLPAGRERRAIRVRWIVSVAAYLGFAMITSLVPIPRAGITPEIAAAADLPGTGLWVDDPWRALSFGFLYFATLGVAELCDRQRR